MGVLVHYLMRSAIVGGLAGGVHGVISQRKGVGTDLERLAHVGYHAQAGALLGPWAPFAVPLLLRHGVDITGCPIMKSGVALVMPKQPPELPTVAEKP